MKRAFLFLIIFVFSTVQQVYSAVWVNDLRELFLNDKAVILAVNPRTMGANDKNGNDIIDFDLPDIDDVNIDDAGEGDQLLEDSYNPSFKGNSSEAKNQEWYEYYKGKAEHAIEEGDAHTERAEKALKNGDEHAYKDHISRAKSWYNDAEKFKRSADIYKNKK